MRFFEKVDRFRIRKTSKGKFFAYPLLQDRQLFYFLFPRITIYFSCLFCLIIFFVAMYEDCGHILLDMTANPDIIIKRIKIWGTVILLFGLICLIRYSLRDYKNSVDVENLKYEGGIRKKLHVTGIKIYSYTDNSGSYNSYYIEAKDGIMIYCSDSYTGGVVGFIESFKKLDQMTGLDYVDDDVDKQRILYDYDKEVAKNQYKGWDRFLKLWHTQSCREVNGHRVSLGDTVTVYIDPENPERYWMDTDFLFEK